MEWSQLVPNWQDITEGGVSDLSGQDTALSADGNIVALSAVLYNNNAGQLRIFEYDGTTWNKLGSFINGTVSGAQFAESFELNRAGDIVAVTAKNANSNTGMVFIYQYDGSDWTQMGQTINGDANGQGQFSYSMGLNGDGDIFAASAPYHDAYVGFVKVCQYGGTSWSQIGQTIEGTGNQGSGYSMDIDESGYNLIVGTWNTNYARVYHLNITIPTTASPTAPTGSPTTQFPTSGPTLNPTKTPTKLPSMAPSSVPSVSPSMPPMKSPTTGPTPIPTGSPTKTPTDMPTGSPTRHQTDSPTADPTSIPTISPTLVPTDSPS